MAADFSLVEVACLACGIEPHEGVNDPKVKTIQRLLEEAYHRAREDCSDILRQNELDRALGREETTPRYCTDAFEDGRTLPTSDLRRTFAEALQDPENRALVTVTADRMRFLRYDLRAFFDDCTFKPSVLFYDIIRSPAPTPIAPATAIDEPVKHSAPTATCSAPKAQQKEGDDRPLASRERNTLLAIIAALCKEAKLDYTRHAKTAGLIQATAARMGVDIGETTIEGHLKKIPDALATRMK